MAYNFLDPNSVNQYRQDALKMGNSASAVEARIAQKTRQSMAQSQLGLDLGKQELEGMKLQKEMGKMYSGTAGRELPAGEAIGLSDIKKSLGILDRLENTVETSGEFGQIRGRLGSANIFDTKAQTTKAETMQAAQVIGRALEGGKLAEGDIKRYQEMLPKLSDSKEVAKNKIDLLRTTLEDEITTRGETLGQAGFDTTAAQQLGLSMESNQPKIDAPAGAPPALNMKGEIAKYGDVIFNEQKGQLETYGKPSTQETVFKKTSEGSEVDNSLLKFLSTSEALPIAGSIVGGLLGAGVASIGTGAAGAVAGKAMQQGLRELLDPDQQDMSDMAKAVLVEGMTDALMGGAFFGIGSVAGKGAKMILSNAPGFAKAGIKAGEEALEEGAEAATKSGVSKTVRDLTARGLNVKPKVQQAKYAASFQGADLVDDIISKFGIPKSGKALQEAADIAGKESGEKLSGLLAGKTAPVNEVIGELEKIQSQGVFKKVGEEGVEKIAKADYGAGVNKLDEYLTEIKAYGDEIPLEDLNAIKQRMQKSFGKSLETSSVSKGLIQDASTSMRKYIEKFHPDIAGTNKDKMLSYMASEIGEELDQKKAKAMFDMMDVALFSGNPAAGAVKKTADLFTGAFRDPLTQARMLDEVMKINISQANRTGVRNTLRLMQRMGVSFGANSVPESPEENQPGMDMEQPPQEQAPGLALGGGVPRYMYR